MKNLFGSLLCWSLLSGVTLAGVPSVSVLVSHADGKVAFKGTTNAKGVFSTSKLTPGDYVVQFNAANAPKGNYAIVVSAGKQKVTADSVAGSKFAKGGVAMRVKVGKDLGITGQIADTASAGNNPNVKVMNGKRMVFVKGSTGSNLGGRWVEEGSPEAQGVTTMSNSDVSRRQDHGDAHQEGFPGR